MPERGEAGPPLISQSPYLDLLAAGSVHPLAHINALLNASATVLLLTGYWLIKSRRERGHKRVMLAAFAVSVLFLVCYLAYHVWPVGAKTTAFQGPWPLRPIYYGILVSHIILAMLVPPLAAVTIVLGLRGNRKKHRKLAVWTFPIWFYVSVTGVVVYGMLYHL